MKFDKRIVVGYGLMALCWTAFAIYDVLARSWGWLIVSLCMIGLNVFMALPSLERIVGGDNRE
jgi:riboflavin transporter FmnP